MEICLKQGHFGTNLAFIEDLPHKTFIKGAWYE